jgi:hypothetical protein
MTFEVTESSVCRFPIIVTRWWRMRAFGTMYSNRWSPWMFLSDCAAYEIDSRPKILALYSQEQQSGTAPT